MIGGYSKVLVGEFINHSKKIGFLWKLFLFILNVGITKKRNNSTLYDEIIIKKKKLFEGY
jgi:hypothetical protein